MSEEWEKAASDVLMDHRYPDGISDVLLALRVAERVSSGPTPGELTTWLLRRLAEGTVERPHPGRWRAADAVMHPEEPPREDAPKGYYRYMTGGEFLALLRCTAGVLAAIGTADLARLEMVQARVEVVHAAVRRRRDESR
jgi:hypothetical protein